MTTEQIYEEIYEEIYRDIHFGYDLRKIREAVASGKISDVDFREWTLKTTCQYGGITISRAERYFMESANEGHLKPFEDLVNYYSGNRLDDIIRSAYIRAKFWRQYHSITNKVRTYIEEKHLELLRFRSDEVGQESAFLIASLKWFYYNTDVLPEQINLVPLGATLDEACQRVGLTLYEALQQCGLHPIRSVSLDDLRKRLGINPETMSTTEQYELIEASLPQLALDEENYATKLLNPINPWWLKEQAEGAERLRREQEEREAKARSAEEGMDRVLKVLLARPSLRNMYELLQSTLESEVDIILNEVFQTVQEARTHHDAVVCSDLLTVVQMARQYSEDQNTKIKSQYSFLASCTKKPRREERKEPRRAGEKEPRRAGEKEPSTTGENEPSTTGEKEPSTTGENEPRRAEGKGNSMDRVLKVLLTRPALRDMYELLQSTPESEVDIILNEIFQIIQETRTYHDAVARYDLLTVVQEARQYSEDQNTKIKSQLSFLASCMVRLVRGMPGTRSSGDIGMLAIL